MPPNAMPPNAVPRWSSVLMVVALAVSACSYSPAEPSDLDARRSQSSIVLGADGSTLLTLSGEENRRDVALAESPRHLVDAVVAIEDARFWTHRGVDARALGRAAVANGSEGHVVQGGSTITQQYVKNALLDPGGERTIARKVKEALLALQLERSTSKTEILELYLNTIYFGNGAYGVATAAQEHFGTDVGELDLAQSATLAGLIQAPTSTDPRTEPERARDRRNVVLRRMSELGSISEDEAAAAAATPLVLSDDGDGDGDGDGYPAPHFVEHVTRFVLEDPRFGATAQERRSLLFGGGLRITTTLDPVLQARAEAAVGRVRPAGPGPEAALVSVEPATGFVRALVGGRDFFGEGPTAQVDLAAGGPGRPAGSAFKPLVLAAALEEGIPLDRVYEAPPTLTIPLASGPWPVENYEGSGGGHANLIEATVSSYNTVYAQLIQAVGPADGVAMAARLGVTTPLQPYPSAVLGTNDVRPLDMASAYGAFATRGVRVAPSFVTQVAAPDGSVLYRHAHTETRVLQPNLADQVNDVLQAVVERGTGVRARIGRPAAGKTGTGQSWTDAWFVGYTAELSTAVWMGFPEAGRRSMVPPATPFSVTGGTWPAEIWSLFMAAALAERPVTTLLPPVAPEADPRREETAADVGDPALPVVADLRGLPVTSAEERLARDGYVVERREVPDDDYPPGFVVGSVPPAGTTRAGGSLVVLDVANGRRASVVVPDLLGADLSGADLSDLSGLVERAGLTVEVVTEAEPPGPGTLERVGRVWKQAPSAGATVAVGAAVMVWRNP